MSLPDELDLFSRFRNDMPPSAAAAFVKMLREVTQAARKQADDDFPSGGSTGYEGTRRHQSIAEFMKTEAHKYGFAPVTLRFDCRPAEEDDGRPTVTFLERGKSRFVVARATNYRRLGRVSIVRRLLSLGTFADTPLFPGFRPHGEEEARTLYVVTYWLDRSDPTSTRVGKIDVVVPTADGRRVYAYVMDLEEYAATAPVAPEVAAPGLRIGRKRPEGGHDAPLTEEEKTKN